MKIDNIDIKTDISRLGSAKRIHVSRVLEKKARDRLSDASILDKDGLEVARMDNFSRGIENPERLRTIYGNIQKDITTIQALEKILEYKGDILRRMEVLAHRATREEDRRKLQEYFDYWSDKIDEKLANRELLTVMIHDIKNHELGKKIRRINSKNLGLKLPVYEGRIGNIIIRNRRGRPISISISYNRDQPRAFNIGLDRETGELKIGLSGGDLNNMVLKRDVRMVLNKLGYDIRLAPGVEEDRDLNLGQVRLEKGDDLIGISISNGEDSLRALEILGEAKDTLARLKKDLENTREGLISIVKSLDYLKTHKFKNVEEALDLIDRTRLDLVRRSEPIGEIRYSSRFKYNRDKIEKLLS